MLHDQWLVDALSGWHIKLRIQQRNGLPIGTKRLDGIEYFAQRNLIQMEFIEGVTSTGCVVPFTAALGCTENRTPQLSRCSCFIEYYTKTTISTMTPKQHSTNTKLEQIQRTTWDKMKEQYKCKQGTNVKYYIPVFLVIELQTCTKWCVVFDSLDLHHSISNLNNLERIQASTQCTLRDWLVLHSRMQQKSPWFRRLSLDLWNLQYSQLGSPHVNCIVVEDVVYKIQPRSCFCKRIGEEWTSVRGLQQPVSSRRSRRCIEWRRNSHEPLAKLNEFYQNVFLICSLKLYNSPWFDNH